jgi:hypothetical protein
MDATQVYLAHRDSATNAATSHAISVWPAHCQGDPRVVCLCAGGVPRLGRLTLRYWRCAGGTGEFCLLKKINGDKGRDIIGDGIVFPADD